MKITVKKPSGMVSTLRQMRLASGKSQRELAHEVGFNSAATISHYENGRRYMTLETIDKVARAHGFKMSVVFEKSAVTERAATGPTGQ